MVTAVYTGTNVNDLTPAPGTKYSGELLFDATAGTTYWIAIDGYNNGSGAAEDEFRLLWRLYPRPANDDFADAQIISGNTNEVQGYTYGATRQSGEPAHSDRIGRSVWYRWAAPANGRYTFNTSTRMAIYSGATLESLTEVAPPFDDARSVLFDAQAGTTYWIAVDNGGEVLFSLSWPRRRRPPMTISHPHNSLSAMPAVSAAVL